MISNPFILYGYESAEYFCDRKAETQELRLLLENGNNVALIAPRRIGKTGLIEHLFHLPEIQKNYYTFLIDIYATKNVEELVMSMGSKMLASLRKKGAKAVEQFVNVLSSLRTGISFDIMGNPTWNVELGDIRRPRTTLDELFRFIDEADKPVIVAVDEFQTISGYKDSNVEALLRTYIQHCRNARFIFAGSQRTMMGNIFLSPSRPFYQSTSMMNIGSISLDNYISFSQKHFKKSEKHIPAEIVAKIYSQFEGITWYLQRVLNELYAATPSGGEVSVSMVSDAISNVLKSNEFTYQAMLYQLPPKQKELLIAISKAGKAENITSSAFVRTYHLASSSSVQAAIKGLLEKDFVTQNLGVYEVYDRFFAMWLMKP